MLNSLKADEPLIGPMPLAMRIASRTFDCYFLSLALLFFIGGFFITMFYVFVSFAILIVWLLCRKDKRDYLIEVQDNLYLGVKLYLFGILHMAIAFVVMLRMMEVNRTKLLHVGILSIPTVFGVWLVMVGYLVLKSRAEYREWRQKWEHTLVRKELYQIRPPVLG